MGFKNKKNYIENNSLCNSFINSYYYQLKKTHLIILYIQLQNQFLVMSYLYFLIPILKNPEQFKKVAFISTIISAIYLFLSVICLLMMFSFISFSEELLSVYLLTRMIEFGRFFQRIDAIFILIWILAMISFLSISSLSSSFFLPPVFFLSAIGRHPP